ncbi:hypothetical protein JVU11DRAFT_4467 [Chiua virens]|nr:hypothetical protein JVU11DRAFT_4467 [Chiua virens]
MATTSRPKQSRKGMTDATRRPAWSGARASPTFSPANTPARLPNGPPAAPQGTFPPLPAHANGSRPQDAPQDRALQNLAGLTGTTITLSTKTGQRYEGVVSSTSPEGDTTGVTLKDAKEFSKPGNPIKDSVFIASSNIENWLSGPADAKVPNGDTFRTDTDISKGQVTRERELQAWQTSDSPASPGASTSHNDGVGDEITFGSGAGNNASWDQFATNEQMFGVTTSFDEEFYTTKLDRSAADYKERERKAQRIASEIMGSTTNNPHVAEERNLSIDDSGVNEEDKYGAVVRGSNAYIPPGARKQQQLQQQQQQQQPGSTVTSVTNGPPPKADVPRVAVNGPDGASVGQKEAPPTAKSTSPAPSTSSVNKPPADPLPAFRDFVTNERQRLTQKKQALVKSEMDKRKAELLKFSQTFKLNKPIPDDLVPILAKGEDKQRQIREKATQDATSSTARSIGTVAPEAVRKPVSVAPSSAKPSVPTSSASASKVVGKPSEPGKTNGKPTISMHIQSIPPFRGNRAKSPSPQTNGSSTTTTVPTSPTSTNRLNANASSFRPNPKANAFTPGPTSPIPSTTSASASASPHVKPAESTPPTPNPFFGTKVVKKVTVHVKDDFNPFKHNKVVEASNITAMWPYSGKRYTNMFPPVTHQPPQQPTHMAPPGPPPVTHPPYEEGEHRVFYVPYYHGQPIMPGMAPPPPGAFVSAPFMQPMPYPPAIPPNAQPPQYMPPPGTYPPPPNGAAPRPSMPPTPTPMHAHPYYHQSPQLQHTVPYQMMMPPGGPNGPPHAYEAGPAPPPMGGERAEYRASIAEALEEDEDPLAAYDDFIKWTSRTFPENDPNSGFIQLLDEVTRKFKDDARRRSGVSTGCCGRKYALELEREGRRSDADKVFRTGISQSARPIERLKKRYRDFQSRPPSKHQSTSFRPSGNAEVDALRRNPFKNHEPAPSTSSSSSKPSSSGPSNSSNSAHSRYAPMLAPPAPGRRPEKLRFNLSLLFTPSGVEYSAQEVRARSMGLLGKKWGPPPASELRDSLSSAVKVNFNEDDSRSTQNMGATAAGGGRKSTNPVNVSEPTVTINTKEALADVFGMYNSPDKTVKRAMPGSKHAPVRKIEPIGGRRAVPERPEASRTPPQSENPKPPGPAFKPFVDENVPRKENPAPPLKFKPFVDEPKQVSAPTPDAGRRALSVKDSSTTPGKDVSVNPAAAKPPNGSKASALKPISEEPQGSPVFS